MSASLRLSSPKILCAQNAGKTIRAPCGLGRPGRHSVDEKYFRPLDSRQGYGRAGRRRWFRI